MQLPNYLTVDNPNIPVLAHTRPETVEYGRFFESSVDKSGWPNGTAQIKLRDMYLPNFSFRVIEAQFTENAAFYNAHAHGSELLGSCVFFQARLKSVLPGEKDGIDLYHRTHNFKYDPNNEYLHLAPANAPLNFVHFSYTKEYLNHILPENELWADTLKARIERRERIMGNQALPINLVQEHALHTIFNCPLSGKLGELMIETSIIQLILLQLHGLFGQGAEVAGALSKQDVGIIHEMKAYLTDNFLQDHSMNHLSRQFGVNANKLMALFRKTFGKSIFEYISELRMKHAMHLLRENNLRVIDVSRTIGYKNPNHFSTAFKKHYGITPSELK
jgi:AraC family transcriptional regulator, transcriptional activator of the genes for pyochelin and ferripyochelin receptors